MTTGIARQGFDLDLRHGQAREEALVHTLLGSRVEAKSDGRCRATGNLFIEYRYRGRPSGISTTTASRWAFEFDDNAWLIVPTDRLREAARRALKEGAHGPRRRSQREHGRPRPDQLARARARRRR